MLSARRRGFSRGKVIGDISTNESLQKYKFEGKELDRSFGLDTYDVHARQYFAMAPMWDRVDKLAEKQPGMSPYVICLGNPVNWGDYNGMECTIDSVPYFEYMSVLRETYNYTGIASKATGTIVETLEPYAVYTPQMMKLIPKITAKTLTAGVLLSDAAMIIMVDSDQSKEEAIQQLKWDICGIGAGELAAIAVTATLSGAEVPLLALAAGLTASCIVSEYGQTVENKINEIKDRTTDEINRIKSTASNIISIVNTLYNTYNR